MAASVPTHRVAYSRLFSDQLPSIPRSERWSRSNARAPAASDELTSEYAAMTRTIPSNWAGSAGCAPASDSLSGNALETAPAA